MPLPLPAPPPPRRSRSSLRRDAPPVEGAPARCCPPAPVLTGPRPLPLLPSASLRSSTPPRRAARSRVRLRDSSVTRSLTVALGRPTWRVTGLDATAGAFFALDCQMDTWRLSASGGERRGGELALVRAVVRKGEQFDSSRESQAQSTLASLSPRSCLSHRWSTAPDEPVRASFAQQRPCCSTCSQR